MNQNPVVLGVLFVLVFIAGFGIGRITANNSSSFVQPVSTNTNVTPKNTTPSITSGTSSASTPTTVDQSTPVSTNSLTDGQRKLLQAFGIDPNKVSVTPQMVACGEAKLGAARIEEIKNGATPSFSEGASLVACYR